MKELQKQKKPRAKLFVLIFFLVLFLVLHIHSIFLIYKTVVCNERYSYPPLHPLSQISVLTDDCTVINEDWIVLTDQKITNQKILLTGNLTVISGTLTMENSTLVANCRTNGEHSIKVMQNGILHVYNSTITASNVSYSMWNRLENCGYKFEVYGNMLMKNCSISYLWSAYRNIAPFSLDEFYCRSGIQIYNNNVTILGSTIKYSQGNGISCLNSSPILQNNIISENDCYGLVAYRSALIVEGGVITSNFIGGILCQQSAPSITNIMLSFNSQEGIRLSLFCSSLVSNSSIFASHVGITCAASTLVVSNSTITSCSQYDFAASGNSRINIRNNTSFDEKNVYVDETSVIVLPNKTLSNVQKPEKTIWPWDWLPMLILRDIGGFYLIITIVIGLYIIIHRKELF